MTVTVDHSRCIGCGMCAARGPAVFEVRGGVSSPRQPLPEPAPRLRIQDAANGCPVNAIRVRL